MPDAAQQICTKHRSKMDVSVALGAGWARVIKQFGRGGFADRLGVDEATVKRALVGPSLPELHTTFNSLMIDLTALDEVAALYGVEIRPRICAPGNDMVMIASVARLAAQWAEAMADGYIDHREMMELARAIRPMMPALNAILSGADRIGGAVSIKGAR